MFCLVYGARILPIVRFYQVVCVYVSCGFPAVMCFGEALPPDQVL